jgi:hypothetical protein
MGRTYQGIYGYSPSNYFVPPKLPLDINTPVPADMEMPMPMPQAPANPQPAQNNIRGLIQRLRGMTPTPAAEPPPAEASPLAPPAPMRSVLTPRNR